MEFIKLHPQVMTLIRPRVTDYYGIHVPQAEVDFAIPLFDEDIPLFVDPFLLWKSPSQQDKALHLSLVNTFNHLGHLAEKGDTKAAIERLIIASECDNVGLGLSASRKGKRISAGQAKQILDLFSHVPRFARGFTHFEEIQFFVEGISTDRISDIACSLLKSFLIDFTIDQCEQLGIPMEDCTLSHVYDLGKYDFEEQITAKLPVHPESKAALVFVPKRWLRFTPWLNFDEYFREY